jgi:hypothetical protein
MDKNTTRYRSPTTSRVVRHGVHGSSDSLARRSSRVHETDGCLRARRGHGAMMLVAALRLPEGTSAQCRKRG